jgi:hypothetical protein
LPSMSKYVLLQPSSPGLMTRNMRSSIIADRPRLVML